MKTSCRGKEVLGIHWQKFLKLIIISCLVKNEIANMFTFYYIISVLSLTCRDGTYYYGGERFFFIQIEPTFQVIKSTIIQWLNCVGGPSNGKKLVCVAVWFVSAHFYAFV